MYAKAGGAMIDLLKDPYERKARLFPGLMVALPLLVPLVCVYGPRHPVLTAVVAVLGGCGALYTLASVTRGRGKQLQKSLLAEWGGLPTTIALRHCETSALDGVSKQRYHAMIGTKLQIAMPTAQEERADPARADDVYNGVAKRLRELTRNNKGLLFKENIAYGFHRNMLAMKPVGIVTSLMGLAYGLIIAKALQLSPLQFAPIHLADPGLAATLTLLVSVALLAAWLLYFNRKAVLHIGFSYAEQLFECLTALPDVSVRKRAAKAVSVHPQAAELDK
ncbi:hypothetical protein GmRootV15_68180 (plasmid) [Variovorax sp. V15]